MLSLNEGLTGFNFTCNILIKFLARRSTQRDLIEKLLIDRYSVDGMNASKRKFGTVVGIPLLKISLLRN